MRNRSTVRHVFLAMACVFGTTSAMYAADGGCLAQITVRTPARELNRNVPVQCWPEVAAQLENDLTHLRGAEKHALQFGEVKLETSPDRSGGNHASRAIVFAKPFQGSPAVITRVSQVVIEGPQSCATWLKQSKLQITPEGFTLEVAARPECDVISATGEWLGFTISPPELINALDPRWLKPAKQQ